jgi:hypothetical protein
MEDRDTIAYGTVEDIFIIVLVEDHVDERDWRGCIGDAMRCKKLERLLLVPIRTLPDVGMRHDIVELHEKHGMKVAVLSDLDATDRVVTALKWGGIEVDGFGTDDLDGMLAFFDRMPIRARMSSRLGPYLDRSWQVDPNTFSLEDLRRRPAPPM